MQNTFNVAVVAESSFASGDLRVDAAEAFNSSRQLWWIKRFFSLKANTIRSHYSSPISKTDHESVQLSPLSSVTLKHDQTQTVSAEVRVFHTPKPNTLSNVSFEYIAASARRLQSRIFSK